MSSDKIVYGNTSYTDLLKEIHKNSKDKEKQIKELIGGLKPLVGDSVNSAVLIVPLIATYLNSSLKNDDNLIKLAQIVQRGMGPEGSEGGDGFSFGDDERDAIIKQVQAIHKEVAKPVEKQNP
jgi:hypothetical protein